MTSKSDVESVSRVVSAPAREVFALLADPARHQEFDGSGTVRGAPGGSRRLELGSRFGMSMRLGLSYGTMNTVVEYEDDRIIAWQTRVSGRLGRLVGGRVWRYELEPADGGTRVTQTWDISREAAFSRPVVRRMAARARRDMAATLHRIDELLTS